MRELWYIILLFNEEYKNQWPSNGILYIFIIYMRFLSDPMCTDAILYSFSVACKILLQKNFNCYCAPVFRWGCFIANALVRRILVDTENCDLGRLSVCLV